MSLPKGVFCVKGRYWYHQSNRHLAKALRGPLTRMPEPNTPEWFRAMADITGEARSIGIVTVATIVDQYKASKWPSLKPNSRALYQSALIIILKAWGHLPPDQISVAGVLALQQRLIDRPAFANQVMVQVKAVMKVAVQMGLRSENPAREIDALKEVREGARPLTDAAWSVLQSAATPRALQRFAFLGRTTGQRISDLVSMRPQDREDDGIRCTITKLDGKPHWCPLSKSQAAIIDGWKEFPGTPLIGMNRKKRHTDDTIRALWNDLAESESGKSLRGFTPHDLRATKVCDERIAGLSHGQIAARVGMSIQMVTRYSRHIDQKLAARGTETERELKTFPNS
ncbi:MAG: tyrosine-type recombinase/integrase [Beijerinckiaceae bacterium]